MPSVATFMMPAAKCVTAVPEDKLSSVVESLVKERIGCVVVVDPSDNTAVGIVTKQDVNRLFLKLVSARADASAPAREQRGRRLSSPQLPHAHLSPRDRTQRARALPRPLAQKNNDSSPATREAATPPVLRDRRVLGPDDETEPRRGDTSATNRHTIAHDVSPFAPRPPEPRRPPWTLP